MPLFLAGSIVSCGALLVLAGAGKVYRGARRTAGSTAIWRALRIPKRLVRHAELAAGGVECGTGTLVCVRLYPVAGGVAMAVLGAVFCALLGYLRVKGVPDACGCLGWRRKASGTAAAVTWRAMVRGGVLCAAGIADALAPGTGASIFRHPLCYAGALSTGVVLMLLSTHAAARTPVCHRRLWRPVHASLRALTGHEVFAAMASAAGPLGSDVRHRRTGCTDEFWFPVAGGDDVLVFSMTTTTPGGSLAIHALVRDGGPSFQRMRVVSRHYLGKATNGGQEKQ